MSRQNTPKLRFTATALVLAASFFATGVGAAVAAPLVGAIRAPDAELDRPAEPLPPVDERAGDEAPPADLPEPAPPNEFRIIVPPVVPDTTQPPALSAESFGVGWPAAVAVGVALLAVLAMALLWRREQPY